MNHSRSPSLSLFQFVGQIIVSSWWVEKDMPCTTKEIESLFRRLASPGFRNVLASIMEADKQEAARKGFEAKLFCANCYPRNVTHNTISNKREAAESFPAASSLQFGLYLNSGRSAFADIYRE